MSTETEILEKESKIYDEHGRTLIPSKIREATGIGVGDKIRFVVIEGDIKIFKADNSGE